MVTCPKPVNPAEHNSGILAGTVRKKCLSFPLDLKPIECKHGDAGGHLVTMAGN